MHIPLFATTLAFLSSFSALLSLLVFFSFIDFCAIMTNAFLSLVSGGIESTAKSNAEAQDTPTDEDRQEAFQNVMLAYHLAHLACVPSSNNHEVLRYQHHGP